jgi:hypothetical protein
METDPEFVARLVRWCGSRRVPYRELGESIDDYAWRVAKLQRRIVEDE